MTDNYLLRYRESTHPLGYACTRCRTKSHLDTVLSIFPSNEKDSREEFRTFAHEHPLQHFHMKERVGKDRCRGCGSRAMGELYGCVECRFYLHQRCFELLLQQIQHPLHPDHPLNPVDKDRQGRCAQCSFGRTGLGYSCDQCSFFIDMRCADMTLSFEDYMKEEKGSDPIRHSTHGHELVKFSVESRGKTILCNACHEKLSGRVRGCRDCLFFLHEECAELPPEIRHYLHPKHPLTLGDPNMKTYHQCNGCDTALYGLVYKCTECSFDLHMECTLQTLSFIEQGLSVSIEHPVYKCSMNLFYSHREGKCSACGEVIVNGPAYFYKNGFMSRGIIHKSCAELPFDIQHPFHTKHPLALRTSGHHGLGKFQCDACRRMKSTDFAYFCDDCEFYLCVACSSRKPTLNHHLHEHGLAYFGQTERLKCNLCHKGCNADLYRCVPCNFNLHRDCLPLPRVVKCRHHVDPLVLYESVIEDDSGEYYCDICEQRRDPDHGAFYCASCKMITDIKCVLPMIDLRVSDDLAVAEVNKTVEALRAELEEVEARRADIMKKLKAAEELQASLSS